MPRLGIIIENYNMRPDMAPLVEALSDKWTIVLFARDTDLKQIDAPFEKRAIPPLPRTFNNRFWKAVAEIFGNIPGSKLNFAHWSQRRITQLSSRLKRLRARILLSFRLTFANLFHFDSLLDHLDIDTSTTIDDIDAFLCTTDVYDVNFLAQLLRAKRPVYTYVYSWDHAGKYHKFSKRIKRYLTWNQGIAQDVHELHGIRKKQFKVVGSTQLSLVNDYLQTEANGVGKCSQRYVYYAGTMGYPEAVRQEMAVVHWLAKELEKVDRTIQLRVRPYPNSKVFGPYRSLLQHKNVVIENTEVTSDSVTYLRDSPEEKYRKIQEAELFIHMGSTIGLEASYLGTPVIHLCLEDFDYGFPHRDHRHLLHTLQQRHLTRYMLSSEEPNVITKVHHLPEVLRSGLNEPAQLLPYNHFLASMTPLQSIEAIAESISIAMRTSDHEALTL